MLTIRSEVQALVRATEKLFSPILLDQELNEDERDMVAMCTQSLVEKYPRAETSSHESLRAEKEVLLHQSHRVAIESSALVERTRMEIQASKAAVEGMREGIKQARNL
jgi:hypothetical protein